MSGNAVLLRAAAALAVRAAVIVQHSEVAGLPAMPAIIGELQLVAEYLHHGASLLETPPIGSRRTITISSIMMGGWIISATMVLLAVPDPAQPWVIASTLAAGSVFATLLGDGVAAVWDRHTLRALRSIPDNPTVQDSINDLRGHLAAATATFQTDRNEAHLKVGQQIEHALVLLDRVEYMISRTPG